VTDLHVYRVEYDGEHDLIVAGSAAQALACHVEMYGVEDAAESEVSQEPDDKAITITNEDDGSRETHTAGEWAAAYPTLGVMIGTTCV
jgi:hypothetical protein